MPYRSTLPDAIKPSIQRLKDTRAFQDYLIKSNVEDFDIFCDTKEGETEICKSLAEQFNDLKEDYYGGRIVAARYKDYLLPLKEFLVDENPDFTSKHLPIAQIKKELNKFW
jgi:hypothetical protein